VNRHQQKTGHDLKETLIIRFGALGDLCICSWFIAVWSRSEPERRFTLVTKAALAPLATRFHGVDDIVPLASSGPGPLIELIRELRNRDCDMLIDAHNNLRSHLLTGLGGFQASAVLQKNTWERLLLMAGRRMHVDLEFGGLDRSLLDRYLQLYPSISKGFMPTADLAPLAALRPTESDGATRIALAPGARWPQKRWPDAQFTDLVKALLAGSDVAVDLFLGPDESVWYEDSALAACARQEARVTVHQNRPLLEIAKQLAACRCLITNDSGLLHLSEATGTPVVAIFGPTTRAFGYFPLLPASRVLEIDLACRPCSRTGSRTCHRSDSACLESITVDMALGAVWEFIRTPKAGPAS
jgi:lipopolysaccharide heptosyltransferase II